MLELKWLWKYMGPKRRYLVIGLCLSAITSAMLIINPMLSQKLIDEIGRASCRERVFRAV